MVGLYPALFVLERKRRETYSTDQDNEVSNTYKNKQWISDVNQMWEDLKFSKA